MAKEGSWLEIVNKRNQIAVQKAVDTYAKNFGLSLSEEETRLLLTERKDSLKEQERVEFGEGILPQLIVAFADSPYIYQENFVDSLGRLQEIFYLYKNESLDEVPDYELIEFMKSEFDGVCQGALDYLEDTSLGKYARKIRYGSLWEEDDEDDIF